MYINILSVITLLVLVDLCYTQNDSKGNLQTQESGLNQTDIQNATNQPDSSIEQVHFMLFKIMNKLHQLRNANTSENKTQDDNPIQKLIMGLSTLEGLTDKKGDIRKRRSPTFRNCEGGCGRPKCSRCGGGGRGYAIGYIPVQIQKPVQHIPRRQPNYGCNRCNGRGGDYNQGGNYYPNAGPPQFSYSQSSASSSSGSFGRR